MGMLTLTSARTRSHILLCAGVAGSSAPSINDLASSSMYACTRKFAGYLLRCYSFINKKPLLDSI